MIHPFWHSQFFPTFFLSHDINAQPTTGVDIIYRGIRYHCVDVFECIFLLKTINKIIPKVL